MNWTRRDSEPFDVDAFDAWIATAEVDDFRYRVERRGPGGGIHLLVQDLPPERDLRPLYGPPSPPIYIRDDGHGLSPHFLLSDDQDD